MSDTIEGQLSPQERSLLTNALTQASKKPEIALEIGTWLGGGSTLHILNALHSNGTGRLWGIEAEPSIYERMVENIRKAAPHASQRFTPLFGLSQDIIPQWLADLGPNPTIDFAFLDGGDHPEEQITEFELLDPHIPVGGQLMAHDAKRRKGRYFVPYLTHLDHWRCEIHDISEVGILTAVKIAHKPTQSSLRQANAALTKARKHPIERIARILPSKMRKWIARNLPHHWMQRILHGRNK